MNLYIKIISIKILTRFLMKLLINSKVHLEETKCKKS